MNIIIQDFPRHLKHHHHILIKEQETLEHPGSIIYGIASFGWYEPSKPVRDEATAGSSASFRVWGAGHNVALTPVIQDRTGSARRRPTNAASHPVIGNATRSTTRWG